MITSQVKHLAPYVSNNSAMQCYHQAPLRDVVGMLYMHEEKATAPAKGKGIFPQSIMKSDLIFCKL